MSGTEAGRLPGGSVGLIPVVDDLNRHKTLTWAQEDDLPPQLESLQAPASVPEGALLTVTGEILDPGEPGDYVLRVGWGDGITSTVQYPYGTHVFTETHGYLDDNPTNTAQDEYPLIFTLEDEQGGIATKQLTVTLVNVTPQIEVVEAVEIRAGQVLSRTVEFSDPGEDLWAASVDYGEGGGPQPIALEGNTFQLSHLYPMPGEFRVIMRVIDDDRGLAESQFEVTVHPTVFRLILLPVFKGYLDMDFK